MSEITTDWTKAEFKAYLLSYVAHANYFETEEEKEVILEIATKDEYKKVHKELAKDNDYQSIQKIMYNLDKFHYTKQDIDTLMTDIKNVFAADGQIDDLEQAMFVALKRIMK